MAYAEVILTENIPHLGAEADLVKVRRGFARNFLIPHGKALEVTPSSLRKINHLKAKRAEREGREMNAAEQLAGRINKMVLEFTLETGETGKAFGSVTAKDIHDRLAAELGKVELPKHAVELDRAFKESGDHEVEVRLHPDVAAKLRLKISTPKRAPAEEETDASKKPSRKKASPKT
ncbi:MAG TPA: 50S ribosomal protein L9 [Terrimicrobiaceae bacterium]|nr:50S ribosomal protein L9 [Terrimicrobiaceae bacterium]